MHKLQEKSLFTTEYADRSDTCGKRKIIQYDNAFLSDMVDWATFMTL